MDFNIKSNSSKKASESKNMFDKCINDFSNQKTVEKIINIKKTNTFFDVDIISGDISTMYIISATKSDLKNIDVIIEADYLTIKYETTKRRRFKRANSRNRSLQIKRYHLGKNVTEISKQTFNNQIIIKINKEV